MSSRNTLDSLMKSFTDANAAIHADNACVRANTQPSVRERIHAGYISAYTPCDKKISASISRPSARRNIHRPLSDGWIVMIVH